MCGIIALLLSNPDILASVELFEGLQILQHRGQDAAGIVTCGHKGRLYQCKGNGMVRDVFDQENLQNLIGSLGIGHVRYPTAGTSSNSEAQPFYVNSPYGIVLAHVCKELDKVIVHAISEIYEEDIFTAIKGIYEQCIGGYACVAMIAAITKRVLVNWGELTPCIFEYVYFARPDSVIDGISVYRSRLEMGEHLADQVVKKCGKNLDIDVVIPVPDTSRVAALQVSHKLKIAYREGFIKNRYVGRTFIMPGQQMRRKSVRRKLNAMALEFVDKNVLIVDDSIVRGTTSKEIVQMARDAGAKKVYFASCAPPIRYPNVYGIDMPSRRELVAFGLDDDSIAKEIGADMDLNDLVASCQKFNPNIATFDCSVFSGHYVTGGVTNEYLDRLERSRSDLAKSSRENLHSPDTIGLHNFRYTSSQASLERNGRNGVKASRQRKERLEATRKRKLASSKSEEQASEEQASEEQAVEEDSNTVKKPVLKFRNYTPANEEIKAAAKIHIATPNDLGETLEKNVDRITKEVEETEKAKREEEDLFNLAPKKPNWDLKRDVEKKLAKLEKKTQA
ncbi:9328_t:CDS:10, partial [Racocetra fulgida]